MVPRSRQILVVWLAALAPACSTTKPEAISPEISHPGPGEVTVAWRTRAASAGWVEHRRAGADAPWRRVNQGGGPRTTHRVTLTGLKPGARYRYRLAGSLERHGFQTPPAADAAFSFLLLWGAVPADAGALVQAELPDFVVVMAPPSAGSADPLAATRASVPVYGPTGPDSRVSPRKGRPAWALDWGGLRLAFAQKSEQIFDLLDSTRAHTIGVVYTGDFKVGAEEFLAQVQLLHQKLKRRGGSPSFVIGGGQRLERQEHHGVVRLSLPREAGSARVDVDRGSVVAVTTGQGQELVLRRSSVPRRRTCRECRRLAERGAYEQSLRAYKAFIRSNQGHYQLDDAHLAIAEILDESLFRHQEALAWYRRLMARYPRSALAPMARQRVKYLQAHSGYVFVPLARFERVRRRELAAAGDDPMAARAALGRVEAIIRDYPRSTLVPVMIYWLANQHRGSDADRAVAFYRRLISQHPRHARAADARVEIGETYYRARRYEEALAALATARQALPGRAAAITAQEDRTRRNLRRRQMAVAAGAAAPVILLLGLLWPPRGVSRRRLARAVKAFVPLAGLILLGGWLVHEQFSGPAVLLGLGLSISAAACFGYPFTAALAHKVLMAGRADAGLGRRLLAAAVSAGAGLLLLACAAYLSIYLLDEHYLTTFKL